MSVPVESRCLAPGATMRLTGTLQLWIKGGHKLLRPVHAQPLVHIGIPIRVCVSHYLNEVPAEVDGVVRQFIVRKTGP